MSNPTIEAHKITRPFQLMAVWFVALFLVDSALLTAACKIATPTWIAPTLVIAAVAFVPLFLISIFLLQTTFRKELQEDPYYAEWLKRQDRTFRDFAPENIEKPQDCKSSPSLNELEAMRIKRYEENCGLFLVHTWRPSFTPGQVADIVVWLHQHGNGPVSRNEVERVEYELGPKFFSSPLVKTNPDEQFRMEVSAWGPMLCLAQVFLKERDDPLILERYINFEEFQREATDGSLKP